MTGFLDGRWWFAVLGQNSKKVADGGGGRPF
jgi:hypothetical protein